MNRDASPTTTTPTPRAATSGGRGDSVAPEPRPRSRRRPGRRTSPARFSPSGLPWILPALVVSGGLIYYCIGYTGWISTLDWNGVSLDRRSVGLGNYNRLFQDPVFWKSLWHTALFFLTTTVGQIVLGLLFAVLLHSRVRMAVIYKVIVFVPVVLAPATMAPVFRQIYAPEGTLNGLLHGIGLGGVAEPWLAQPGTALAVVISIQIWASTGVAFILYFAAISQIDPEVIEAARMDGAGNIRVITSIIWPSVRGTTLALITLSAIASLNTFDVPYLVTNGGPNYATEFLGTFIYRISVPQSAVGYGAAISIMLLVLATAMAVAFNIRSRNGGKTNA